MVRTLIVGLAISLPVTAFACGGDKRMANKADAQVQLAAVADANPTHCAKKAELVGGNCSYSTGMMAQRVLEMGQTYTFTGLLAGSDNKLDSRVAAPYTVGPDNAYYVVANEVVEQLVTAGADKNRVTVGGKILEVDGVSYFVATDFQTLNT